jgi:hypothetical protein
MGVNEGVPLDSAPETSDWWVDGLYMRVRFGEPHALSGG